MNKIFSFLTALVIFITPAVSNAKNASWTIMVYMNADNDLEEYGIADFLEMAAVPNSERINVLVQMDRSPLYTEQFGNWTQTLRFNIKQNMNPNVSEAMMDLGEQNMGDPLVLRDFISWSKRNFPADKYMLIIWDHGDGWRAPKVAISDPELIALYKADYLKEKNAGNALKQAIFQSKSSDQLLHLATLNLKKKNTIDQLNFVAKFNPDLPEPLKTNLDTNRNWQQYSADYKSFFSKSLSDKSFNNSSNYQMVTLVDSLVNIDFEKSRFLSTIRWNVESIAPVTTTSDLRIGISDEHPSKAVSNDDTNNDVLYNKEIQDNLVNNEVDILGFDACLMSMIETAYTLRSKASFIVGSEELEPGSGWNYTLLLQDLLANPEMPPLFLSKSIVENYRKAYQYYGQTTLSAIDMSLIQDLADQIENLSKYLIKNIASQKKNIASARENCLKYAISRSYLHSIDLSLFLDHLSRQSSDTEIRNACGRIRALIELLVVEKYSSADRGYIQGIPSYGSFGLAIYFPARKQYLDKAYTDQNTKYPVQFVQDCSWDNLLLAYFQ